MALLSGEPERTRLIAQSYLQDVRLLFESRGLNSYMGSLPNGSTILSATSHTNSANPNLMRSFDGITEEYRRGNVLNYEMKCGTLFKMAGVYNSVWLLNALLVKMSF